MFHCGICESIFGPKPIGDGVRQLQTFKGYTVDFRLQQFRKVPLNTLPEFTDFDSLRGKRLLAEMHIEAIKQLHNRDGNVLFASI